ncbi:pilus assembly protein TadG-related protein [Candidatus Poriferisodalis sp.]|uniref:pilus assembly protein TadG-related protein n=1 Tax=Candidatus Poriferisodalis sp. TaxID=3101277 RepID=UPI003AF68506
MLSRAVPAVLKAARIDRGGASQDGSGTAIGVAIMFPVLMLVIVALQGITSATRTEQTLQAIADRAAHTAVLCCMHIDEALLAAQQSVEVHERNVPGSSRNCTNDVSDDALVAFRDVSGAAVPELDVNGDPNLVPAGGQVTVLLSCRLSSSRLGAFSLVTSDVHRRAVGSATVDPYRQRFAQVGTP